MGHRSGRRAAVFALALLALCAIHTPAQASPSLPASALLAFTSGRACADETGRCNRDVFAMDPGTSQSPRRLAPFPGVDDDPAISPDGRRIVFSSDRVCDPDGDGENEPGCRQNRDLYLMQADGSRIVRLTDHPHPDHRPKWSPLGASIVFHRERPRSNGRSDIIVKHVDATPSASDPETPITEGNRDFQPAFSPSGHQIAFTRLTLPDDPPAPGDQVDPALVGANIFVYDFCAHGDPVIGPLANQPGHPDFDQAPVWRPDPEALRPHNLCEWDWRTKGELAFGSLRDCADPVGGLQGRAVPGCSFELYKMPAATGTVVGERSAAARRQAGPTRLTSDVNCSSGSAPGAPPPPEDVPNCPQDLDPTYSPDGSQLGFWSDRPEPDARRRSATATRAGASGWPTTGAMAAAMRYLRASRPSTRQGFPQEDLQAAEDNDVYVMSSDTGMAGGMTNLTPDGNRGDAEKYDDMAPAFGVRAGGGGGGGGGDTGGGAVTQLEIVKFEDADLDGRQDRGEPPLAGVRFFADLDGDGRPDPGETTATTGRDGRTVLPVVSGTLLRVLELTPEGFVCTLPNPCYYDVTPALPAGPLVFGNARTTGGGSRGPAGGGTCIASPGFRSASVAPAPGGGLRIRFRRRVARPVAVDIFQVSQGRRVLGERLVARFRGKRRSFRWSGRGNRGIRVTNGFFFARFRIDGPRGTDIRRVTFRRSGGRFFRRPPHHRRTGCRTVRTFKLERPTFGGRENRALRLGFQLNRDARVRLVVRRGSRVVRRFGAVSARAGATYRRTLPAAGRPRGDYRVVLVATAPGQQPQRLVLVARRL